MGRSFILKLGFKAIGTGACIALMMASWLTMAELLQRFEETYDKQIFLVYFVQSFSSILYVVWKCWLMFPGDYSCNRAGEGKLDNFKRLLAVVIFLTIVGTPTNIFWYLSLAMTRISANTAIYQSTPALVFLISIPVLRERVTLTKILSVALTVVGVCLVSLYPSNSLDDEEERTNTTMPGVSANDDDDEEYENPLGYAFVIISVLLYAVYQTFYKRLASREDDTAPIWNVVRVLGYTGVLTLFFFWPVLIIAHFSGLETFEFPPTWPVFFQILAVCFLDSTFNISLLVCISISSPLFASVASILTVPVAVLLDLWLKKFVLSWQALIGVSGVLIGFVCLTMSEVRETKLKAKEESEDTERLIPDESNEEQSTEKKENFLLEESHESVGENESLLPKRPKESVGAKIQFRENFKLKRIGVVLVEHII